MKLKTMKFNGWSVKKKIVKGQETKKKKLNVFWNNEMTNNHWLLKYDRLIGTEKERHHLVV